MKKLNWPLIILFFSICLFGSLSQAKELAWLAPDDSIKMKNTNLHYTPTSPPREYFSLNTLFLDNNVMVHVGYDIINQNYVVMPSPNVKSIVKLGDKLHINIQQYFPELENKILSTYKIPASKLSYLYITGYEIYDQSGALLERIMLPENTQYRPPQYYSIEVPNTTKMLSFVFTFNGRTAWSDTGINTDLQGLYRNLNEINIDRNSAIHIDVKPNSEINAYEVLTSNENQQLQQLLSEFHHIVVWGRMAQKEELINKIIDLKNFEAIDIELAKGVEDLRKYPQIFGDPLNPKWQSVINHISSERLNESEMNTDGKVSAKLGLGDFFSFGGSASSKRNSRLKEMVKFNIDGNIYIPKSLHFVTRKFDSFELIKDLVFQAYDRLEEASFKIGVGMSLDQSAPRATMDHLYAGEKLQKGEYLTSNNGEYMFVLQDDGNLVLYRKTSAGTQWLWDYHAAGHAVSHLVMQSDGNLVVYGYPNFVWGSMTQGHPGAYLVVQDDGNVVIYDGNRAIWSTR